MLEKFEYSIANPETSFIRVGWEQAKRFLGWNYLWVPSQYRVVIKQGFVLDYSGEDLPSNILPLLFSIDADYSLYGRSGPWDNKKVLAVGLLLDNSARSFTLQNRQFNIHLQIFNTEYHLKYTDTGSGIAERAEVTDDLITKDMQHINEIGTHQIDERRARAIDFTKKGFPERVDWVATMQRYLPVKNAQGVWVAPELSFEEIHRNLLVGVTEGGN